MYRSWIFLFFIALVSTPLLAHAQSVLAPIINLTGGSCTCPGSAPDWGCVLQTAQTALNDIVAVSTIIITLYIAWAGVDFISSPTNVEGRTKARQRVVNAVLGLLIVLCAWLLVDSFLKVIYNASASATGVAQLGPWNQLLSDTNANDQCIKTVKSTPALPGLTSASNATGGTATAATGGTAQPAATPPAASTGTGSCNATTVQNDAAAGGYPITATQAGELACIAQYESNCGAKNPPYNNNYSWGILNSNGKASTAAGPFQVLLSSNSSCYNNVSCEQAGGTPGVPLNCKSAFTSSGLPITSSPNYQACEQAAGNTACSAAAAACQLQQQSFSSMYGADAHAGSCASS